MAKKIIFSNQKGGVAKTTTTLNISAQFAKLGYKTLMVDLDPQASLTIVSGYSDPGEFEERNLSTLVEEALSRRSTGIKTDPKSCIYPCVAHENLFILPCDINLSTFEFELIGTVKGELTISKILSKIEDNFDYICIDCPPSFGALSVNGFLASDIIIGCCEPAYQALRGLQNMFFCLENLSEKAEKEFNYCGVVVTREGRTNTAKEAIEILKENYNVLGEIKELADTVKGEISGYPVSIYKPSHINSREFYDIAQKIIEM